MDAIHDTILKDYGIVFHDTIQIWLVECAFGRDNPVKLKISAANIFTIYV